MSRAVLTFVTPALESWHTALVDAPRTARARARAELTREIKEAARRQLRDEGAAALSLRAVARELGMVSSAVYRYFPSRDDLLTALITDAYDAVGEAAERADATCDRDDIAGRWSAACHAIRRWARRNPHEYALVYGSPVPGYRAPQETTGPASRPAFVLTSILVDGWNLGVVRRPVDGPELTPAVAADAARLQELAMPDVPLEVVVAALVVWAQLFGTISFELFGHFVGVVDDRDAFFDHAVAAMAAAVGVTVTAPR